MTQKSRKVEAENLYFFLKKNLVVEVVSSEKVSVQISPSSYFFPSQPHPTPKKKKRKERREGRGDKKASNSTFFAKSVSELDI